MKTKININKIRFLIFFSLISIFAIGKDMSTQTVRGVILDQDAKIPLIGANVIITGSDPILGTSTDANGNFRLDNVPVGRIDLHITCVGYEDKFVANVLVGSGKEVVLEIEVLESVIKLDEAVITATRHKSEALNEMATVSAKAFTVEETKRYAGSLNDPARMVSGYAGVTGDAQGNNDIVVRGNSPKGILWRLDGFEIPNPNHFADEGSTGGPINALNSSMLSNSDFFSGAFAPEYGNAYSGVFDMKLRSGNNENREYSASVGLLGLEATLEGPFKKYYSGSYLVNYRYSSLAILDKAGIVDYYGIPTYQDGAFKVALPTQKAGTFFLIGFGGKSSIYQEDVDEETDYLKRTSDFFADVGFLGLNHVLPVSDRTFIKTSLSLSGTENANDYNKRHDNGDWYLAYQDEYVNTSARISTCVNTKINARHRFKLGATYSHLGYKMFAQSNSLGTGNFLTELDTDGNTGLLQAYINWKYRITEDLTLISGLHYMQLMLNNSNSIEPRLALKWDLNKKQSLTFGAGIHSKQESISTYFASIDNGDGTYSTPNKDLELSKAVHYVLGYSNRFSKNMSFRVEAYYQQLFNLAVENDPGSSFVLNNIRGGYDNRELINEGSGKNYGLELTLERFYANDYYFLFTSSLYESKLTAMDDIERNSRFNGNYASNLLIGKEFKVGNRAKNKVLGINAKISMIGGHRYTPIDLDASIANGEQVYHEDQRFAFRGDDIFNMNLALTYRRNRKKTTHEFKIDVQNITNNKAKVMEYYDDQSQVIEYGYQLAIMPNIIYTIQF